MNKTTITYIILISMIFISLGIGSFIMKKNIEGLDNINKQNVNDILKNIKNAISVELNEPIKMINLVIDEEIKNEEIKNEQIENKIILGFEKVEDIKKEIEVNLPLNENLKKYTHEELSNMSLVDLKKVAKDNNIVLSIGGKAKGKPQLIVDILAKI